MIKFNTVTKTIKLKVKDSRCKLFTHRSILHVSSVKKEYCKNMQYMYASKLALLISLLAND